MSRPRLPEDDDTTAHIKRLYNNGVSVSDISKAVFMCETMVRNRLKSVGVELRKSPMRHTPQQVIEEIRALHDEGLFQNKIAEIVGVSIPTVHKYIKDREINYA